MWDLKLSFLINFFMYFNIFLLNTVDFIIESITPYLLSNLQIFSTFKFYYYSQNQTIFFIIKFLLSIAFLILIRGGTPRYRYDYLTKLGWLKFIGLVVFVFVCTLLIFFLF